MFSYDELTSPERALWDAFPKGRRVDLRPDTPQEDQIADGAQWGPERTVRAAVLCALLLGANSGRPGTVAQLRLTGARIRGRLDLAGAQIAHPLWLEACWFDQAVNLLGASTQTLVFTSSRIPGIEADSARIEGNSSLRHSVVEDGAPTPFNRLSTALSLTDARISGALLLNGAHLIAPDGWALPAGGPAMEGGIFCRNGFTAHGEVRLIGAQLPGTLVMHGARLEKPGPRGVALTLDNATASSLKFSQGFTANGTVRLRGTQVRDNVTLDGAVLNGPPAHDAPALTAMHLQAVDLDLTLARPPSGTHDLRGAQESHPTKTNTPGRNG